MKALFFEITGKFAHFRRFYTNSSSLTYPIPPPPTIAGLLGASIGLTPQEYPDVLEDVSYIVIPRSEWRTVITTINLLMIRNNSELSGYVGHTQIPTQFLFPRDLDKKLVFEIGIISKDETLLDRLKKSVESPVFPPFLGVAYCPAIFEKPKIIKGEIEKDYMGGVLGAIKNRNIVDITPRPKQRILRDRYPLKLDKERKLLDADDILVDEKGEHIGGKFKNVFITDEGEAYGFL